MNFDDYKNNMRYPDKNDYVKIFLYTNGACVFEGSYIEYQTFIINDERYRQMCKEEVFDKEKHRAALMEYNNHTIELLDKFQADLEKEFGVEDNPKKNKLYSIAWDMGHSSGLSEVYHYYSELVELIN